MSLTADQLTSLALAGALDREIVVALGHPMTPAERATVDKARVLLKLRREQKRQRGPITDREKHNKANQRDRLIPFRDPDPAEVKRRAKLEKDPELWLRHYLPERFPLPFGPVHREIIKACLRGMQSGTSVTVAAPRGFGKTAILWGMALYGVMTGRCRFPVVIGWKQTAGAELLSQWIDALSDNDRLAAGYPCICDVFRESTASKRLQGLLRCLDPEQRAGCDLRRGRGTVLLPETREPATGRIMPQAALAGASMNGSIKGLNVGLLDGESLRPDMVMMDDPQDEATAASEALITKVIRKIDYGLRSLSGPQRRLTVMAAVTCVEVGDVSDHLLNRPGTDAIRCGQVLTWPAGWADKDSPTRAAWNEWNAARLEGLEQHDGGKAARVYYRTHKAALTAGMTVTWRHRYHVGDAERASDPDALFAAMWDFYDLGELAFMAERQNAPIKQGVTVYGLTAELIESRTDMGRAAFQVPPWGHVIIAATDINHYGLHSVMVAFGNDQSAAVIWYSRFDRITVPENAPSSEISRIVFEMLAAHGAEVDALPVKPGAWIIDGGYEHAAVQRYVQGRRTTPQAVVARGFGFDRYRPWGKNLIGKAMEMCHRTQWPMGKGIAWQSDHWHEVSQRAWLGSIGAPGACSLFAGHHREFSEHVAAQRLAEKLEGKMGTVWRWLRQPGRNDWGDALAMAYMGAAVAGIGTGGRAAPRPRYVEVRRCKVPREQ